jgi:hypothetical protein
MPAPATADTAAGCEAAVRLPDSAAGIFRHPIAAILYGKYSHPFCGRDGHVDSLSFAAVLHGVVDQIQQDLPNGPAVHRRHDVVSNVQRQLAARRPGKRRKSFDGLRRELAQAGRRHGQARDATLAAGKVEHVVDEMRQPSRFLLDDFE